jgi:hypothetical protein
MSYVAAAGASMWRCGNAYQVTSASVNSAETRSLFGPAGKPGVGTAITTIFSVGYRGIID